MKFQVEPINTKDDKRLLVWQKEVPVDYICWQAWTVNSHCYQIHFKIRCSSEKALELRTLNVN